MSSMRNFYYIIETYLADDYGNRSDLIRNLSLALQGDKADVFMEAINRYAFNKEQQYAKNKLKEKAADLSGKIEHYIKTVSQGEKEPDDDQKIVIAKKLLVAKRADQAINWLSSISETSYHCNYEKELLLIKAYKETGQKETLKTYLWSLFEKSHSIDNYKDYLKLSPKSQQQAIRRKAISHVVQSEPRNSTVEFLDKLGEYEVLNSYLLEKSDKVNGYDYGTYRPISRKLATKEYYLIAALLRRQLLEAALSKAQSKYYKYAVDDYRFYQDFARNVSEWGDYQPHDEFMAGFNERHKRKKAFWRLIDKIK